MLYQLLCIALCAALSLLATATEAFVPPISSAISTAPSRHCAHVPVEIFDGTSNLLSDESLSPAIEAARQKFWFYFFAGSGAGGIGIAQLPAIFVMPRPRGVAGVGPSRGGSPLNAGPLLGLYYNTEIALNDVLDAIQKAPSAEFISSRSQSINFMASKGYIERRDFIKEMEIKKCNPLASYVLYDAISSGKGDVVSPVVYDGKLAAYRQGSRADGSVAGLFVGDLNGFLAVKVGAFLGLLFCLLVDFGFIAKAGIEGFLS
ncbi:hypothetical protein HJC23_001464 [Cyclotella cryptica]|uniref:Uncharacterized protein n=1 Tax=Cyclotella cryptica TaxID=29204 RepID=A0ABD3NTU8_9STRA|eukprot:CCRYP_019964-RA/>CCRYP_019964-RA protein AED:0.00 eAED:0.00 QI:163/-1/1/1/-1/1/1/325/260